MNCDEIRPLIEAHLDGELDLVHSVAIEQHLESCAVCRAQRDRVAALTLLLRARVPRPPAPAGLEARVRTALAEASGLREAAKIIPLPTHPPAARWLAAAAGIAVLLGMAFTLLPSGRSPGDASPLLAEALNSHARAVLAGPLVAVASTDRHTVKPWLAERLDFSPPVVDLASAGFPLVGGRLDYLARRTVAALVYARREHRIDVFIAPGEGEAAPAWTARDGFRAGHWTSAGMSYAVVSDLGETELREFAAALRSGTERRDGME